MYCLAVHCLFIVVVAKGRASKKLIFIFCFDCPSYHCYLHIQWLRDHSKHWASEAEAADGQELLSLLVRRLHHKRRCTRKRPVHRIRILR